MRFETPDPGRRSKAVYSPRMASSKKPVKTAKPAKSKPKSRGAGGAATRRVARPHTPTDTPTAPPDIASAAPALFDPLTPGEVADALRTLTEDRRLSSTAKVGRYRTICSEPLVVKPPHWM